MKNKFKYSIKIEGNKTRYFATLRGAHRCFKKAAKDRISTEARLVNRETNTKYILTQNPGSNGMTKVMSIN